MPRYDFKCEHCDEVVEVERSIENRNRSPRRCREVVGATGVLCGGKYIRLWVPVPFCVNR